MNTSSNRKNTDLKRKFRPGRENSAGAGFFVCFCVRNCWSPVWHRGAIGGVRTQGIETRADAKLSHICPCSVRMYKGISAQSPPDSFARNLLASCAQAPCGAA